MPWAQRALGLFVVLWLNIAIQPCAMAMVDGGDHNCPHCPPTHTGHHDSSEESTNGVPCDNGDVDCGVAGDINHDGRPVQLKLKDLPTDTLVAIHSLDSGMQIARSGGVKTGCPSRSPPPGIPSSLNVLYCVYLD